MNNITIKYGNFLPTFAKYLKKKKNDLFKFEDKKKIYRTRKEEKSFIF